MKRLVLAHSLLVCLIAGAPAVRATRAVPLRSGAGSGFERYEFAESHMGTRIRIVLYATESRRAREASRAAFESIAVLDAIMSDFRDTSELSQVCDKGFAAPVRVSVDLFEILKRAQRFSTVSGGAFDVTAGPLIRLWRRSRRTGE